MSEDWFDNLFQEEVVVDEKTKPKRKVAVKKAEKIEPQPSPEPVVKVKKTPKKAVGVVPENVEKEQIPPPKDVKKSTIKFNMETDFCLNRLRGMVHGKVDSPVFNLYVHDQLLRLIQDMNVKGFDISQFNNTFDGIIKVVATVDNNILHFNIVDDRINKSVEKKLMDMSTTWLEYVNADWVDEEVKESVQKKRISIMDIK